MFGKSQFYVLFANIPWIYDGYEIPVYIEIEEYLPQIIIGT